LDEETKGEMSVDPGDSVSRHYYVSANVARAMYTVTRGVGSVERQLDPVNIAALLDRTRSFCIEQSFYAGQEVAYRQDPVRHVFATAMYCLYKLNLDPKLCVDFITAIARGQAPNGSWPN